MLSEQKRNAYADTNIYIRSAKDGVVQGVLEQQSTGLTWKFSDLVELMGLYETLFNALQYPQATHRLRRMKEEENAVQRREMKELEKKAEKDLVEQDATPTFIIKIKYRQNASWQGTIHWVEGDTTKNFRSTLELIRLMDSAIGGEDDETARW